MVMDMPDMTLPLFELALFWLLPVAFGLPIFGMPETGAGTGWTVYPPLSDAEQHDKLVANLSILSLHLAKVFSLLGAINLIVTTIGMRRPDMGFE
jgi:cytochrome c oxidase subunit 1